MDQRILQIVLQARDEASKTLKSFSDQSDKTGSAIKNKLTNNTAELGVAFATTTGIIATSVAAFAASEDASAQLDAVLTSTKGAAGVTADEVLRLSSALQQQSKFEDEAITGAQNMLLTFTNISKDVFPQTTQTVLDMSQALGQDLNSSAMQLGKALNDPIAGVTALRKVGVNLTEDTREQIKTFVEQGDVLSAQRIILNELSTEFGGSAKAAAEKFNGELTIMKNNLGDTQEIIGQGLLEAFNSLPGGIDGVNAAIVNMNKFLSENKGVLLGITFALIAASATLGGLFLAALVVTAGTAGVWVAVVGAAVAAVGFMAGMIVANWQPISGFFSNLWSNVTSTFNNASNFTRSIMLFLVQAVAGSFMPLPLQVLSWINPLTGVVSNIFNNVKNAAVGKMNELLSAVSGIWDRVRGIFDSIRNAAQSAIDTVNRSFSAGGKVGVRAYETGGWVPNTGPAILHAGEYVLSRDMLAGRQPIAAPIPSGNQKSVNIEAVYVNNTSDIDTLMRRISGDFQFNSSLW